jgi:hypothetical protein
VEKGLRRLQKVVEMVMGMVMGIILTSITSRTLAMTGQKVTYEQKKKFAQKADNIFLGAFFSKKNCIIQKKKKKTASGREKNSNLISSGKTNPLSGLSRGK